MRVSSSQLGMRVSSSQSGISLFLPTRYESLFFPKSDINQTVKSDLGGDRDGWIDEEL
jgi:hypothetical protein